MNRIKRVSTICMLLLLATGAYAQKKVKKDNIIEPGAEWKDTNGNRINAHGGGILYHKGVYYWYGEHKGEKTYTKPRHRTDAEGVSCYSSKDLVNWKFEGVVLKPNREDSNSDLHPSQVLERPKVIYNDKTKKFVMWMHIDSPNYAKAAAGVAVSDSPAGNFKYLGSMRPNEAMSRDMTLFKDDDGKAYHIYSSEHNKTMYISLLTDDYLKPSGTFTRNFIDQSREAPAVFKYQGKYYILTSGCTGWDPNRAEYAVADAVLGPWTVKGDPCTGKDAHITFYGQSTHVFPIAGKKGAYIAMFDQWKKNDLADSRYLWLPVIFKENSKIEIPWIDRWSIKEQFK